MAEDLPTHKREGTLRININKDFNKDSMGGRDNNHHLINYLEMNGA